MVKPGIEDWLFSPVGCACIQLADQAFFAADSKDLSTIPPELFALGFMVFS